MKTNQEQIMKALAGLIPEDAQKQVGEAISEMMENAIAELDTEYNQKLEDAYKKVTAEKTDAEKVAEQGYAEAWEMITDLKNRIEIQKEEFDQILEKEYESAWQMLQEEKSKNDALEIDLYEQYDKKLDEIKKFMVDKIDEFLETQGEKYYEMARRDVLSDPAITEHKLAFEKILEVTADYISDEDYIFATNSKLEAINKSVEEQKAQMKILEAKNMRLATENSKLNEVVREQKSQLIVEGKKERVEKAKKVEGRGRKIMDRQVVIGEVQAGETVESTENQNNQLVETVGEAQFNDWVMLSSHKKAE
jgi:hypothetical protein